MRHSRTLGVLGLLESLTVLLVARAALAALPLRWSHTALGLTSARDSGPVDDEVRVCVERVKEGVARASQRLPASGDCLAESLAAATMLRFRGIRSSLHFGVLPSGSAPLELKAHAWLTVGDLLVTGEGMRSAFTELGRGPGYAGTDGHA